MYVPFKLKRRLSRHLNFNSILTSKWTKYFNSFRASGTKSTAKQNSKAFSVEEGRCVFWENRVIKFRFLFVHIQIMKILNWQSWPLIIRKLNIA